MSLRAVRLHWHFGFVFVWTSEQAWFIYFSNYFKGWSLPATILCHSSFGERTPARQCVFMILCLCVPLHMHMGTFILHNKSGNLISALCTISFFSVTVDVSFYRRGLANSCVCRRRAETAFVCRKEYLKPVSDNTAAKFFLYTLLWWEVVPNLVFAFTSPASKLYFKTVNSL